MRIVHLSSSLLKLVMYKQQRWWCCNVYEKVLPPWYIWRWETSLWGILWVILNEIKATLLRSRWPTPSQLGPDHVWEPLITISLALLQQVPWSPATDILYWFNSCDKSLRVPVNFRVNMFQTANLHCVWRSKNHESIIWWGESVPGSSLRNVSCAIHSSKGLYCFPTISARFGCDY